LLLILEWTSSDEIGKKKPLTTPEEPLAVWIVYQVQRRALFQAFQNSVWERRNSFIFWAFPYLVLERKPLKMDSKSPLTLGYCGERQNRFSFSHYLVWFIIRTKLCPRLFGSIIKTRLLPFPLRMSFQKFLRIKCYPVSTPPILPTSLDPLPVLMWLFCHQENRLEYKDRASNRSAN